MFHLTNCIHVEVPCDVPAARSYLRRYGGDPKVLEQQLLLLGPIRDQVIANAALGPGKRVLDVGCGDGLIASAAAKTVGPQGHGICSDISQAVLDLCRERATESAVVDRCSLLKASAGDLAPIEDETVGAVTVRSVQIYESNKAAALANSTGYYAHTDGCRSSSPSTATAADKPLTDCWALTSPPWPTSPNNYARSPPRLQRPR